MPESLLNCPSGYFNLYPNKFWVWHLLHLGLDNILFPRGNRHCRGSHRKVTKFQKLGAKHDFTNQNPKTNMEISGTEWQSEESKSSMSTTSTAKFPLIKSGNFAPREANPRLRAVWPYGSHSATEASRLYTSVSEWNPQRRAVGSLLVVQKKSLDFIIILSPFGRCVHAAWEAHRQHLPPCTTRLTLPWVPTNEIMSRMRKFSFELYTFDWTFGRVIFSLSRSDSIRELSQLRWACRVYSIKVSIVLLCLSLVLSTGFWHVLKIGLNVQKPESLVNEPWHCLSINGATNSFWRSPLRRWWAIYHACRRFTRHSVNASIRRASLLCALLGQSRHRSERFSLTDLTH